MELILMWAAVFAASLFCLLKGSDYFVDAAECIGLSLGIPSFVVGVTIVALGTSIPELASSVVAVLAGSSEIVAGNVAGSNITNVFLVVGFVLMVGKPGRFEMDSGRGDLLFLALSALLFFLFSQDGVFVFWESLICALGVVAYSAYHIIKFVRNKRKQNQSEDCEPLQWHKFGILALSLVVVYFSAKYNIQSIIELADIFNVGKEYISLTAVALGTSLPELFVSLAALKKGSVAIAIGNVVGSNIFNIFAVMGIPGMIGNLEIKPVILEQSMILFILATVLILVIALQKKSSKWRGGILLALYGLFLFLLMSGGS